MLKLYVLLSLCKRDIMLVKKDGKLSLFVMQLHKNGKSLMNRFTPLNFINLTNAYIYNYVMSVYITNGKTDI